MSSRGFMYDVDTSGTEKVVKIPRSNRVRKQQEQTSYEVHKIFLWDTVPDTKFFDDENTWFKVEQDKVYWEPVNILQDSSKKLYDILKLWQTMQEKQKILFDIFWMQWMIALFNYFFAETNFKKFNDLFLPLSEKYLKAVHNFPPWVLAEMNQVKGSPFIAHNLLKDSDGNYHFIDTDYRPIDIRHPLNVLWDWITKKALQEVERLRPWDLK
jgi:hypothetical protein